MNSQQLKERATKAAGTMAGVAADPKTGLSHMKSKVTPGRVLFAGAVLLTAYLFGRRSVRHGG